MKEEEAGGGGVEERPCISYRGLYVNLSYAVSHAHPTLL
jgi:hypothetical protein